MPLISRSARALASSTAPGSSPNNARDALHTTWWSSSVLPAWLAYDLSAAPTAQRSKSLVAIYAERSNDWDTTGQAIDWELPVDYVIETNSAAGGGQAPSTGWTTAVTVTDNVYAARHHLVDLRAANWIRVRVTDATGPSTVSLDLDVYHAPNGGTDDWLFLGDSITSMTLQRLFQGTSLSQRVNNRDRNRWPAQIGGGVGGTNTENALAGLDAKLAVFPGRFVVLAYGTNDGPRGFQMEAMVTKVIAAGKTPVVPKIPWSDTKPADIAQMNTIIEQLYVEYPQILRGPDLYTLTLNRTDYIPSGDVHPTEAGRQAILNAYAAIM